MVLSREEWLIYVSIFIFWMVILTIFASKDPPEGRV